MSLLSRTNNSASNEFYFALKSDIPAAQTISRAGNTISLSGGGGSVNVASATAVALSTQKLTAQTYNTGLNSTNFAGLVVASGPIRSAPPLGLGTATLNGGLAEVTIGGTGADPTVRFQKPLTSDATISYDGVTLNVDTHLKVDSLLTVGDLSANVQTDGQNALISLSQPAIDSANTVITAQSVSVNGAAGELCNLSNGVIQATGPNPTVTVIDLSGDSGDVTYVPTEGLQISSSVGYIKMRPASGIAQIGPSGTDCRLDLYEATGIKYGSIRKGGIYGPEDMVLESATSNVIANSTFGPFKGIVDANGTVGTVGAVLSAGNALGEVRWMGNAMASFGCIVTQTQGAIQYQHQDFVPLGISQATASDFNVAQSGMYMMTASIMFATPTGGNHDVYFWLVSDVKGGIPYSNTRITIPNNDTRLATVQWIIPIDGNDNERISLHFASSDAAMTVLANMTPPYGPQIPAVILTIHQLSDQVLL